jgi:RNA polymerase sigma factor (sigma-70 family)
MERTAHDSDATLIARTRAGDDHAYAELYARHSPSARATAWSLLRSQQEVDDVTSEAFARVLAILRDGRGPDEAFRPYLLTCVRRGCVDRGASAERQLPVDPGTLADRTPNRDDEFERRTESEFMASAFTSLPVRWRQVLWLTEVERRSHVEVGTRLGLAPAAVAALAARARQGLSAAYLRAHLGARADRECRTVAERLPMVVRGSASASDLRRVAAHLARCPSCRAAERELHDLNGSLRSLPVAAVVGCGALAAAAKRGWLARRLRRLGFGDSGSGASAGATAATGSAAGAGVAAGAGAAGLAATAGGVGAGLLATIGGVVALVVVPSAVLAGSEGHATTGARQTPAIASQPLGADAPTPGDAVAQAPVDGHAAASTAASTPSALSTLNAAEVASIVGGTAGQVVAGVRLAGVSLPPIGISSADGSLSLDLGTPSLGTPSITTPALATPAIGTPAITVPPVLPPIDLPAPLPPVTLPPVGVPPITVPSLTVPPVTVPSVTVPSITIPTVTVPVTLPVTIPPITLPPVTLPPIG